MLNSSTRNSITNCKNWKFIVLIFSLLIFSCTSLPSDVTDGQEKPIFKKLAKGVYAFIGTNGNANAGFVLTKEGVIVIDSQMNEDLAREMLAEIRRRSSQSILYVINTHHHGDHTFANHIFAPTKGIIAHENALKFLEEHGEEHLKQFKRFFGQGQAKGIKITLPTITIQDQLTLVYKKTTIEIRHLGPGHTNGDLVVYLPGEKILFSGDLVYSGRLPWLGDGNTRSWLKTIEKLKALEFQIVVPGHGMIGGRKELNHFESYLTNLRAAVVTSLLQGHSLKEMKEKIQLSKYQADLKYSDWLPLHIEKVYREMQEEK